MLHNTLLYVTINQPRAIFTNVFPCYTIKARLILCRVHICLFPATGNRLSNWNSRSYCSHNEVSYYITILNRAIKGKKRVTEICFRFLSRFWYNGLDRNNIKPYEHWMETAIKIKWWKQWRARNVRKNNDGLKKFVKTTTDYENVRKNNDELGTFVKTTTD